MSGLEPRELDDEGETCLAGLGAKSNLVKISRRRGKLSSVAC
jgi:hypothetical protein